MHQLDSYESDISQRIADVLAHKSVIAILEYDGQPRMASRATVTSYTATVQQTQPLTMGFNVTCRP
jgi:hypothetical protein